MLGENGKYVFGTAKVGESGQLVIPKEAREMFGIKAGDTILVLGDTKQGGLALINLNSEMLTRLTSFGEEDNSDGNTDS